MSEFYEGVVSVTDLEIVGSAFDGLDSKRALRLVTIHKRIFGIYPMSSRSDRIDETETNSIARQLSNKCGNALSVLYDNRTGFRASKLFHCGTLVREFGEDDEHWVLLDDDGFANSKGSVVLFDELDPNEEYDCVRDAIFLGLAELGAAGVVTPKEIKQAFCYNDANVVAELQPK